MAVTKRTRYEVLRRDNHTCRYCGASAPDAKLTVDHVTPLALGGTDDPSNLVAACQDCNFGKASTVPDAPVVADVKQSDITWADAMRQATEIRLAERDKLMTYLAHFRDGWYHSKPSDWENSVSSLYAAGLPMEELDDAMYAAQNARGVWDTRFVYFCGAAWKRVRKIQEIAKAIADSEATD